MLCRTQDVLDHRRAWIGKARTAPDPGRWEASGKGVAAPRGLSCPDVVERLGLRVQVPGMGPVSGSWLSTGRCSSTVAGFVSVPKVVAPNTRVAGSTWWREPSALGRRADHRDRPHRTRRSALDRRRRVLRATCRPSRRRSVGQRIPEQRSGRRARRWPTARRLQSWCRTSATTFVVAHVVTDRAQSVDRSSELPAADFRLLHTQHGRHIRCLVTDPGDDRLAGLVDISSLFVVDVLSSPRPGAHVSGSGVHPRHRPRDGIRAVEVTYRHGGEWRMVLGQRDEVSLTVGSLVRDLHRCVDVPQCLPVRVQRVEFPGEGARSAPRRCDGALELRDLEFHVAQPLVEHEDVRCAPRPVRDPLEVPQPDSTSVGSASRTPASALVNPRALHPSATCVGVRPSAKSPRNAGAARPTAAMSSAASERDPFPPACSNASATLPIHDRSSSFSRT